MDTSERRSTHEVKLTSIGLEQHPVFVVDDFFNAPEKLLDEARSTGDFNSDKSDYYPGVRKAVNAGYTDGVCQFVLQHINPYLSEHNYATVSGSLCAFSIPNQSPRTLLPIQRIPHFDAEDPRQWAVVHYLCGPEHGGTGFFRHRATGFEAMTEVRSKRYQRVLEDEAVTKGLPPEEYLQGSTELFEMTHAVEAKFNRAIIYPGNLFHSGLIKNWQVTSINDARLTVNSFVLFE